MSVLAESQVLEEYLLPSKMGGSESLRAPAASWFNVRRQKTMSRILFALGTISLFIGIFSFIGAVEAEANRMAECGFEPSRSFACRIGSYYDTWALVFGGLGIILFIIAWQKERKSPDDT